MEKNIHGFEPKQEFTMGGIAWTVIQTGKDWIKCIASKCISLRAFDEEKKNNFSDSSIRRWLNSSFLQDMIRNGMPEEALIDFVIDLTADDGLTDYAFDRVKIGLITCEEYRKLRKNIPEVPGVRWWTATSDSVSPRNVCVKNVYLDGTLFHEDADFGGCGVRPVCMLKSEIMKKFFDKTEEKQKQRAEAVDMVKHIAAAWDIRPGEIFGRG